MRRVATGLLLAAAGCLASAQPARALYGDSDAAFGLDGTLRSLVLVIDNYDFEPFFGEDNEIDGSSQTVLRMMAAGRPTGDLSYEVHALAAFEASTTVTAAGDTPYGLVPSASRYRAVDLELQPIADDDASLSLIVDRAAVRSAIGAVDLTVGRQAITFGKAYFWNPLDPFLAFDPRQFDRDFKPGVDALRIDLALGDFSGLTVVGAAGRTLDAQGVPLQDGDIDASWYGSALLGRLSTHHLGWDAVLQGGKVYGGAEVGGGIVGEILGVELRGEATYFFADRKDSPPLGFGSDEDLVESRASIVVGLGRRFESSLVLQLEYLYNGAGDPDELEASLVRFANGLSFHLSRNITGGLASYELSPLVVGQAVWLQSWDDGSGQVQPTLRCSLSDEADLVAGATLSYGERPGLDPADGIELESEFGSFADVYFLQFQMYF